MRKGRERRSAALLALWLLAHPHAGCADELVPGAAALNPLGGLSREALSGFRDRPLFNPSRVEPRTPEASPPPAASAPPEPVVEPPPALHLVGIVSGHETLAMVRPLDGGKTSLLATGDKLGAWTATVSADGLSLRDDARTVTFRLFQHGGAAEQATASGGAPPSSGALPPTGDPGPP